MSLCLKNLNRPLQYRGSWKKTTFHQYGFWILFVNLTHCSSLHFINVSILAFLRRLDIAACEEPCQKPLHFDGKYANNL